MDLRPLSPSGAEDLQVLGRLQHGDLEGEFDAAYALDWLRRILDPDDTRLLRFARRVEGETAGI